MLVEAEREDDIYVPPSGAPLGDDPQNGGEEVERKFDRRKVGDASGGGSHRSLVHMPL